MRLACILGVAALCLGAAGQSSPPSPLTDTRLSIHTLVREDVFAGVLDNDMERLALGEKKIDILLEKRPGDKPGLLVWKASIILFLGVLALEANRTDEFEQKYARAITMLAEAKKLGPRDFGVDAATAGMFVMLADRLPEKLRGEAWSRAYDSYRTLWNVQSGTLKVLPLHLRGELLGGLAQSAQRTGRTDELKDYLKQIVDVLPDTAYARVAKEWQADPKVATTKRISCLSCHAPGRLAARQAALDKK
jgi:hypothetical protein